MALATNKLIWLKQIIHELKLLKTKPLELLCDNQAVLHIASNLVFHERTKHSELNCHFNREKITSKETNTVFVNSNEELADVFVKSLQGLRIDYLCNKLGVYDISSPT